LEIPGRLLRNVAAAASSSSARFVGYRVREELIGIGVKDAVGRTADVSGTVTVDSDAITTVEDEGTLEFKLRLAPR
jgi:hypothetical protein